MNLAIKLVSIGTLTIIAMAAFLMCSLPGVAFMSVVGGVGIALISVLTYLKGRGVSGWHPDLERIAQVVCLSNDADEIRGFALAKQNFLSETSFKNLLARLESLNADKIIFEDSLKQRIEDLPQNESLEKESASFARGMLRNHK